MFEEASGGFNGPHASQIEDLGPILSDRALPGGRRVVIGGADGPHHIWFQARSSDQPLTIRLIADAAFELRQAMAARLLRRLGLGDASRHAASFQPSPFQRQRLNLLLALIDRQQAASVPPPLHELARELVYPGMDLGRGLAWKGSNERRRTQRLVEEAHALMAGGYRALLRGAGAGATKTPRP